MDYDVIVVGAGPVGLMLACELRLGGARVLVLERLTEIDRTIKAGAITGPCVEALYRRGFLPAMERARRVALERAFGSAERPRAMPKVAGHFGAIWMHGERIDDSDPDFDGRGPVGGIFPISQQQVEEMLVERALELGVELRRGVLIERSTVRVGVDEVGVMAGDRWVSAGWLVGCDGGRSAVRKLAGFEFPGTDPEITAHQAIVELTGADGLERGWNVTERGVYVYGPQPGRILTVEFDGTPEERSGPVTAEELQASLRAVSGVDVTITGVESATRFTDNARQVPEYRNGRVLLAGDAAHVHSPFGGQGLSLGIGDALNLGWKLTAAVRGWAPDGLLDSYTAERHPIGAWVLDWTRAQVAVMRPEPKARALRAVVTDLAHTVTGTTYFAKKISGWWQGYDLGGGHELVGRSAPDLAFAGGGRLGERLADGRALLVDLGEHGKLRELGGRWGDRVRVLAAGSEDRPGLSALLVRPDGYVAWAADGEPDLDTASAALSRWFG
ncbi:FAD-dependent monooxygenase [Pseudonocardia acaciae]|uniref:FAD-dependent monooxygenase n=1 Tax=Pseudonocardia acaciae TaxID=551276 RepID=UPI00048B8B79|nr:FAD-dependent monooxygenase [Pseudonocardia acaciae]